MTSLFLAVVIACTPARECQTAASDPFPTIEACTKANVELVSRLPDGLIVSTACVKMPKPVVTGKPA